VSRRCLCWLVRTHSLTRTAAMQSRLERGPRNSRHLGPGSCACEYCEHSISKSRAGNDVPMAVPMEEGRRGANRDCVGQVFPTNMAFGWVVGSWLSVGPKTDVNVDWSHTIANTTYHTTIRSTPRFSRPMLHAPLLSKLVVRLASVRSEVARQNAMIGQTWTIPGPIGNRHRRKTHRVCLVASQSRVVNGKQPSMGPKQVGAMGHRSHRPSNFQSSASRGSLTLCSVDAPICILLRYRMPSRSPSSFQVGSKSPQVFRM